MARGVPKNLAPAPRAEAVHPQRYLNQESQDEFSFAWQRAHDAKVSIKHLVEAPHPPRKEYERHKGAPDKETWGEIASVPKPFARAPFANDADGDRPTQCAEVTYRGKFYKDKNGTVPYGSEEDMYSRASGRRVKGPVQAPWTQDPGKPFGTEDNAVRYDERKVRELPSQAKDHINERLMAEDSLRERTRELYGQERFGRAHYDQTPVNVIRPPTVRTGPEVPIQGKHRLQTQESVPPAPFAPLGIPNYEEKDTNYFNRSPSEMQAKHKGKLHMKKSSIDEHVEQLNPINPKAQAPSRRANKTVEDVWAARGTINRQPKPFANEEDTIDLPPEVVNRGYKHVDQNKERPYGTSADMRDYPSNYPPLGKIAPKRGLRMAESRTVLQPSPYGIPGKPNSPTDRQQIYKGIAMTEARTSQHMQPFGSPGDPNLNVGLPQPYRVRMPADYNPTKAAPPLGYGAYEQTQLQNTQPADYGLGSQRRQQQYQQY